MKNIPRSALHYSAFLSEIMIMVVAATLSQIVG